MLIESQFELDSNLLVEVFDDFIHRFDLLSNYIHLFQSSQDILYSLECSMQGIVICIKSIVSLRKGRAKKRETNLIRFRYSRYN